MKKSGLYQAPPTNVTSLFQTPEAARSELAAGSFTAREVRSPGISRFSKTLPNLAKRPARDRSGMYRDPDPLPGYEHGPAHHKQRLIPQTTR